MGIKMGVPLFKIQQLIEAYDVKVYSSNYALYGDMSQRVMVAVDQINRQHGRDTVRFAVARPDGVGERSFRNAHHAIRHACKRYCASDEARMMDSLAILRSLLAKH